MSFDIPFEDGKGIELGRPYWEFLSWPEIQLILIFSNNGQYFHLWGYNDDYNESFLQKT